MFAEDKERIFASIRGWRSLFTALILGAVIMGVPTAFWSRGVRNAVTLQKWGVVCAVAGAIAAAVVVLPRYRLLAIIPGMLAGFGSYATCLIYLLPRERIVNVELLLPIIVGAAPGYLLLRLLVYFYREPKQPTQYRNAHQPTNVADLGQLIKTYRADRVTWTRNLTIGSLLLIIAASWGYIRLKVNISADDQFAIVAIPTISVLAGMGFIGFSIWKSGLKASIHENGLESAHFGRKRIVLWDNIRWVKEYVAVINAQTIHRIVVAEVNGNTTILNHHLQGITDLSDNIQQQVVRRQLPIVLDTLARNETVTFGDLTLIPRGFEFGGNELRFEAVKSMQVENGTLLIHKLGQWNPWYSRPLGDIPNARLLLEVFERSRAQSST